MPFPKLLFKIFFQLIGLLVSIGSYAGDWATHTTSIHNLDVKLTNYRSEIERLIVEKNHTENSAEVKRIVTEMIKKHKLLKAATTEHNEVLAHIRYEHPEHGDNTERKYSPMGLPTLEEIESDMGIESKMNHAIGAVRKRYGSFKKEKKPTDTKSLPKVSKEKTDKEDFENLRLSK